MKITRRTFIQGVTASLLLPLQLQAASTDKKTLVIGVGVTGRETINYFKGKKVAGWKNIYNSRRKDTLQQIGISGTGQVCESSASSVADTLCITSPFNGSESLADYTITFRPKKDREHRHSFSTWKSLFDEENLIDKISGYRQVFLVSGLAGFTGGGLSAVITQVIKTTDTKVHVIGNTPFQNEGSVRHEYAQRSLKLISEYADSVVTNSNQETFNRYCAGVSTGDTLEIINIKAAQTLYAKLKISQRGGLS